MSSFRTRKIIAMARNQTAINNVLKLSGKSFETNSQHNFPIFSGYESSSCDISSGVPEDVRDIVEDIQVYSPEELMSQHETSYKPSGTDSQRAPVESTVFLLEDQNKIIDVDISSINDFIYLEDNKELDYSVARTVNALNNCDKNDVKKLVILEDDLLTPQKEENLNENPHKEDENNAKKIVILENILLTPQKKGNSNKQPHGEVLSGSERSSVVLFSSDTDEDPIYYPSDSEYECSALKTVTFPYIRKNQVHSEKSNIFKENKEEIEDEPLLDSDNTFQNSSDKLLKSPEFVRTYPEDTDIAESATLHGENGTKDNTKVNLKTTRKPDFCYYCESEVQNFARHIHRNHSQEFDVQKIFTLAPKSIERKRLIASLRKKGNFLKNSESLFKPVHKCYVDGSESSYVPCPFCLGLYSRKLLWKHKKICPQNRNPGSVRSLSEGQNLLLPKLNINPDLRLKVFPRMRADKVSLTAKKDSLICAFGARYLNTHREQHHINICSRKMRELAKILMESQKVNSALKNLYDLLHPQYFDIVVHSAKIIAKYDPQNDIYLSPTFGMNISRTLKDCCDIAILHLVKRKYNCYSIPAAEAEANVNTFKSLLESTWKHEISSQAGNDLNTKTWNKITIIPLAADLKLLRTYLIQKGNEAEKKLKENMDNVRYFNLLMETIFCRLLLLNRKRVGELQRMKLATYMLAEEQTTQSYEEFSDAITPSEKILLKSFKRVVIRGKRGRGVPVLFSNDMQNHINLLLQARPHFIDENNLFLFCSPNSEQPIVGYKVLQKHSQLCGAKNPKALTSTKLRKHLATLTQVFNMTNSEIEQLATFMGHTINVHSKVYRLPDDVFQTAKIAKLLMLMEKGDAANYKGKTLEEIDVNMDEEIILHEDNLLENDDDPGSSLDNNILEAHSKEKETSMQAKNTKMTNNSTRKTKKRQVVPWTTHQKKVVLEFFKDHITSKKPPKKGECNILLEQYPELLKNKSWVKIKVFIQNCYTKRTKLDKDN